MALHIHMRSFLKDFIIEILRFHSDEYFINNEVHDKDVLSSLVNELENTIEVIIGSAANLYFTGVSVYKGPNPEGLTQY